LLRVLAVYLGASFAVLEAIDLITDKVGLPGWVFPGTVVLLLLGLPVIVATALAQGLAGAAVRGSASLDVSPARAKEEKRAAEPLGPKTTIRSTRWLTWKRAILGGVLAFALLGIATTGFMVMRVLGVGPVGSLVAAGVLDERDRIILADFKNTAGDSLLAVVATEALRIDFAQSPTVTVAEPEYVAGVLGRMGRESDTKLDLALAREVAVREGLGAVIAGEITAVGGSYVLAVQIVAAEGGQVLAGFRETAKDTDEILAAIDRLSKKLRERIGESYKSINSSPPLERVTTGSLEALQKHTQAVRAIYTEGDVARGIALLEDALALDSTFAAAWAELGTTLMNRGEERAKAVEALTKAYEYRDRLSERERYLMIASYHIDVTYDWEAAITAYNTLLETYPNESEALNNLGWLYNNLREQGLAEEYYRRALAADSSDAVIWSNVVVAQGNQGKLAEARATLDRMAQFVPGHPSVELAQAGLASTQGRYEEAAEHLRVLRESRPANLFWRGFTSNRLAGMAIARGHLAEAEQHLDDAMAAEQQRGLPTEYLENALWRAQIAIWFRGATQDGLRQVDEALARYPLQSIPALDRPYLRLSGLYALAERPDLGVRMLREYDTEIPAGVRHGQEAVQHSSRGIIALAEGRAEDAVTEFTAWDEKSSCSICALPFLGRAYDMAGQADSTVAVYERYIATPWFWRFGWDAFNLPLVYERLGQLYEKRGDRQKAIYYYGQLIEHWEDADAELQPRVEAAHRAIATLSPDR
jgi:tetratricopeptide (TPR) repeat protein